MAAFQYFSKAKYRPAMLDLLVTHARRQASLSMTHLNKVNNETYRIYIYITL
jgi:hypothetical protein